MSGLQAFDILSWAASLVALAACAATDFQERIIPNRLVAVVAAIGLSRRVILEPQTIMASAGAAVVVLCILGVLAHRNIVGGGDVKLVAAATLLAPPERIGALLMAIALSGGALACAYLIARSLFVRRRAVAEPTPSNLIDEALRAERARVASGGPMPYALAVLGGIGGYVVTEALR